MQVWIAGVCDRLLTEEEATHAIARFEEVDESCDYGVRDRVFYIGWLAFESEKKLLEAISSWLPANVSASIAISWTESDAEDCESMVFTGPDAKRLHLKHIDEQIAALQLERERVASE